MTKSFKTYFQYLSWFLKFWLIYITVKYIFNFFDFLLFLNLSLFSASLLFISAIVIIHVCSLIFGNEFFLKLADKQGYQLETIEVPLGGNLNCWIVSDGTLAYGHSYASLLYYCYVVDIVVVTIWCVMVRPTHCR